MQPKLLTLLFHYQSTLSLPLSITSTHYLTLVLSLLTLLLLLPHSRNQLMKSVMETILTELEGFKMKEYL